MKSGFSLAALAAAALLAAGCGGGAAAGDPGAASIVPGSVVAYVAIDSDPSSSQWRTADDLAARFPGKQKAVDSLERSFRSDSGLDFERDVKPALGPQIDVVWLDLENGGRDVLALTQPADEKAFAHVLDTANAKATSSGDKVAYEKVDGWEVVAADRQMIDEFKARVEAGGTVLGDEPSFKQAMSEFPSDTLVKAWVDGASVTQKLRSELTPSETKVVDKLGMLDWAAAALSTSSDGVRLDFTVRGTPGSLLRSAGSSIGSGFHPSLPGEVPSDVLAYLAFHGTRTMFSGVENTPTLAGPQLKPVRRILHQVGALLAGEDALYVRSGSKHVPEVTLVAEPSDGTDGAVALDSILRSVKLGDRIARGTIAGVDARTLRLGAFALHYGDVGGKLVVTDLPAGIVGVQQPGSGLAGSDSFRDAARASGMPDKVQSFLYVDVRGGLALVQRLSGTQVPSSVVRNIGPLKSALEYAATRPSEVQLTFFVRIG